MHNPICARGGHPVPAVVEIVGETTFLSLKPMADAWASASYLTSLVGTAAHVVGEQAVAHPHITKGVVALTAAAAGPALVVGAATVAGFGAGGIVAGSAASWFMGTYGGTVAAGSLCAVAQSIGAAGLGTAAWALVTGTSAAVGAVATKAVVG